MLRLLGAVLLTGGAGALGFGAAARLNRRVHMLRLFTEALERMERELSFRLTSIPELFALLADHLSPPVGTFFARCRGRLFRLGEERLEDLWRNTLAESDLELEPEEQQILETLGGILGRYDSEGQTQALALARAQLEQCMEAAVSERARMGKVYGALGLAAGAVILAAALEALQSVRELLDELAQTAGLEPAVLAPVVKTVGVAIITRVTVEVCKDAGEGGIAAFVEIAGSAAALYLALPLVRAVLSAITGLL